MPPLRIGPPPLPSAQVSQLGTSALIRFLPIADSIDIGDDKQMTMARIELLMLTERYPALTAPILAQGLDRERAERLELARLAVESAAESAEERRRQEERLAAEAAAAEAGLELPPEETPEPEEEASEEEDEEAITEEQRLLNQLPGNALREWREAGVEGHILVEAAQWFEDAVDELWDLLGMPTAIVDTRRAPQLPRPSLVIEKAAQLARTHPYEGRLEVADFLNRAAVVAAIPFEDVNDYVVDGRARVDYNIGTSSSGPVRTRYYFAARAVDTEGNNGRVDAVLALAPGAVPLAPVDLTVEVTPAGTQLEWLAPAGDVWGDIIEAESVRYNIYRRVVDSDIVALAPINFAPIAEAAYLDTMMSWGERYLYEVRAVTAPPSTADTPLLVEPDPPPPGTQPPPGAPAQPGASLPQAAPAQPGVGTPINPNMPGLLPTAGPPKESSGALTRPVAVVDTFAPDKLLDLEAVRAARRITLRWSASFATDLVGYRVYRRQLIDDPCDPRYIPDDEDGSESDDDGDPDCQDEGLVAAEDDQPVEDDSALTTDSTVDDATDNAPTPLPDDEISDPSDDDETNPNEDSAPSDAEGDDPESVEPDADAPQDEPESAEPEDDAEDDEGGENEPDDDDGPANETRNRRRRNNELVSGGWEILTAVVISDQRYTDPTAADDTGWEFAVEAVDDAGNVSEPAVVKVRLESEAEVQ